MKRSSNTDGDNSVPDKKAKISQSSSPASFTCTESSASSSCSSSSFSFSQSSPSSSSNTLQETTDSSKPDDGSNFESSPLDPDGGGGNVSVSYSISAEELASAAATVATIKERKKIREESNRLEELKSTEMQKLILLFVNRPYKPYSSDKNFYNALQLTNLVVGARRECKYKILRGSPPYSLLPDKTNSLNYFMSRNEYLAYCTFKSLAEYQDVRNQTNGKKRLKRKVALRGEFVQTNGKKAWECGYCKQPITSAVTGCFKAWGRWDNSATTFPYWTRCEQEETNICLTNSYWSSRSSGTEKEETGIMLSEKKWCKTCVEKECQRVVGIDENEINRKTGSLEILREAWPNNLVSTILASTIPATSFFPKMMEVVGDIVDPYSLTQELYKNYVRDSTKLDQMLEEFRHRHLKNR